MAHWRTLCDDDGLLYAHHLQGKSATVTIERVSAAKLVGQAGRATRKPCLHFRGTSRALAICKTDARTLERISGSGDVDRWVGQTIVLVPTTTRTSDGEVPCIRIAPRAGKATEATTIEAPAATTEETDHE